VLAAIFQESENMAIFFRHILLKKTFAEKKNPKSIVSKAYFKFYTMIENSKYAYFFLRLPLALSMLGHGLVRMPKLQAFSDWMVGFMEKSWFIPKTLVVPFSYFVTFSELIIGILLFIGLFTRQTIYFGLVVMAMLVWGSTAVENWDAISSQLIHAIYFGALLLLLHYDRFSADWYMKKSGK
jgi:Predicted membrane protein